MAYDATTGTVLLFGGDGVDGVPLNDTWIWNGITWEQQFPPISPPARAWDTGGMAYDSATKTVVLFSGVGASGVLDDTWEWSGITKTWNERFPASHPTGRHGGALTYDAFTRQVLLFGGDPNVCCSMYGDTWTWDGNNWTERSPAAAPSPRTMSALAYDASIGRVILFGGTGGVPGAYNDTWSWDGSTWTQRQTSVAPRGRWAASMVYDNNLGGLLLFGGELAGDPFTNSTWIFSSIP